MFYDFLYCMSNSFVLICTLVCVSGGSKMSHWTHCSLSTTDGEFFTKISGEFAEEVFNNP